MPSFIALPFTDDDLTGAVDIVFSVNGVVTEYTATVELPSVSTTYGFYPGGNSSYGWNKVRDALNAVDPDGSVWLAIDNPSSVLPFAVRLLRQGTNYQYTIKWTHASTTFDGTILGFDATVDTVSVDLGSNIGGAQAPYQLQRLWYSTRYLWTPKKNKLRGRSITAQSANGLIRRNSVGSYTFDRDFNFSFMTGARIWTSLADDPDLYTAVPLLTQGDPNFALEATWEWMGRRSPIKFTPNSAIKGVFEYYQVADDGFIMDLESILDDNEKPRSYSLIMPFQEFVPP